MMRYISFFRQCFHMLFAVNATGTFCKNKQYIFLSVCRIFILQTFCESIDSELVQVETQEENEFLKAQLRLANETQGQNTTCVLLYTI